jgi:large exoprotein involved in heme utilization and adhesion
VQDDAQGNGGRVKIKTGSLSVTNGAELVASTFGEGDAGNVNIIATDSVSFDGVGSNGLSSGAFSSVQDDAQGNGGSVNIKTDFLSVANGATVSTSTFGEGDAGNVNITATDSVSFDGVGSNGFSSGAFSTVQGDAQGNGGNVKIKTRSLSVANGATVSTSTFGEGDAGNVNITATDSVSFDGVGSTGFSSGAFSTVQDDAQGKGGDINIQTGSLRLTNGATVSTSTFGEGNAGNIEIVARDTIFLGGIGSNGFSSRISSSVQDGAEGDGGNITTESRMLSLTNGAQMNARSLGFGRPGNIQINATESVKLESGSRLSTLNLLGNVLSGPSDRGNVRIETGRLLVQDGSDVTVSSGIGDGGNIEVNAGSIELNNQSKLIAETLLGSGGNITLNVQDLLLLRRNSQISATADSARITRDPKLWDALVARGLATRGFVVPGANGGNITINAPFIVAVPKENSDIRADAFQGRGGRVQITAQGVFGIEPRPRLTPLSDITASSELGINGEITINTPGVDPSRGLAELPTDVVDASTQIDRRCTPSRSRQQRNSFIITGRGGLPPSPDGILQGESVITNWVTLDSDKENNTSSDNPTPSHSNARQIVEAQGWVFNEKGQVVLTASAPKVTPQGEWLPNAQCNPPHSKDVPQ